MKLLIVTQKMDTQDPILGFFHAWVCAFAQRLEHVHVICLSEGQHDTPDNVTVYSLGKERGGGRLLYTARFYRYVWHVRHEYDAVFVHMNPEYVVIAGWLWRLLGKRVWLWYTHKSVTYTLRIAHMFVHGVFTASRESFRLSSDKVQVVGHGIVVPDEGARKQDASSFRIITIGRLSRIKKIEVLIRAVHILHTRHMPVQCDIVGGAVYATEEEYAKELRTHVREHGLDDIIHFHGSVPHRDIYAYLHHADVMVNMSETGSLDKAGLEAMAAGIPVITSNEAFSDIMGTYASRLCFPARDIEALCARLLDLATSEDRDDIGQYLRERVRKMHSLERLIPQLLHYMKR